MPQEQEQMIKWSHQLIKLFVMVVVVVVDFVVFH